MAVITLPTSGTLAATAAPALAKAGEAIEVMRAIRQNSAGAAMLASCADLSRDDVIGFSVAKAYAAGQWIPYAKQGDKLENLSGLTKGATYYLAHGTDEVQTITITGTPTGGSFTLSYGGQTTGLINHNANAAAVQAALEALSSIGAGNVSCGGGALPGTPVTVTFLKSLGGQNVALMTDNDAGLTGGTAPAVAVTETTPGETTGKICLLADLVAGDAIVVVGYAISATELIVSPKVMGIQA